MTENLITPAQVEQELRRLMAEQETATDQLGPISEAAARAEVRYKVAFAQAMLQSFEKAQHTREADATTATADLLLERRIRESEQEVCRERLKTIRNNIDALRTIAANLREQAGLKS